MKQSIKRKTKTRKQTKQKGGANDFGFILTRCVRSKEDNQIWKNCYKSIRRFYKEKILIITDGSVKELIDEMPLENVQLIDSEFPGAGELLPYYYFHKLKPFKKAVCMQDSMWFLKKFDFKHYHLKDVVFLWDFPSTNRHFPEKEIELAKLIDDKIHHKKVLKLYETNDWKSSFGVCSFMTLDFVNKLEKKFHMLDLVHILNKERTYRHSFERIFGVLCYLLSDSIKHKPSIFGTAIFETSTTMKPVWELKELDDYNMNDNIRVNPDMIKLFRGR